MSTPSRSSNATDSGSARTQLSDTHPADRDTAESLEHIPQGASAQLAQPGSNDSVARSTDEPAAPHVHTGDSFEPLVRKLPDGWTPEYCFDRLRALPGCVWLDSNLKNGSELSRFSYMAADPFTAQRVVMAYPGCLAHIKKSLRDFYQPKLPDLPPFQGGWLGWFGYELGSAFENIPRARYDDFKLPAATLGAYDVVLAWDHLTNHSYIISQGWPRKDADRVGYAYRRLKKFLALLEGESQSPKRLTVSPLSASHLAPQFDTRWTDWTSNFDSAGYRNAVAACVEYIQAGDIFQANLSQRLLGKSHCESSELYKQLRILNSAPFAGYADFGRVQVLSCSPERFVQLSDGSMEARPIKGTRPRLSIPTADRGMATLLRTSQKDISENVMIVDLLRNDLSRVAEINTVKVPSLCDVEQYPYVWHLVSTIVAQLRSELDATDLIAASFPGGSITGAPKIRAMEIIAELEPTVRGPYCGSLGYISFAGDMDLNILIRTLTACDGWWQVPVGGGIVAESDPVAEEQETWHKAEGMLRAIDKIRH